MKLSYVMMLMVLPCMAGAADVRAFKCTDAKGNATFSTQPCAPLADPPRPEAKADEAQREFARLDAQFHQALGTKNRVRFCPLLGDLARQAVKVGDQQRDAIRNSAFEGIEVSKTDILDIEKREIRLGMSKCAVLASWGVPEGGFKKIARKSGKSERWIYGKSGPHVIVEAGVVTTIEN
jgi:hypothetical protein